MSIRYGWNDDGDNVSDTAKSFIPEITTVGYNGRRGDGSLTSQGWNDITGAPFTPTAQT
ncbi:hypothetical protein GKA92_20725, partial [Salmonella enterica subsp. enterica]|nr:hypothetical protein [Salmonella enterica subsp. enterica serovar Abaetetuba]